MKLLLVVSVALLAGALAQDIVEREEPKVDFFRCFMANAECLIPRFGKLIMLRPAVELIAQSLSPLGLVMLVNDDSTLQSLIGTVAQIGELKRELDECFGAESWLVDCNNQIKQTATVFGRIALGDRFDTTMEGTFGNLGRMFDMIQTIDKDGLVERVGASKDCLRDLFAGIEVGDGINLVQEVARQANNTAQMDLALLEMANDVQCSQARCMTTKALTEMESFAPEDKCATLSELAPQLFAVLQTGRSLLTDVGLYRSDACPVPDTYDEFVCANIDACHRELEKKFTNEDANFEQLLEEYQFVFNAETVQMCHALAQETTTTPEPTNAPKLLCKWFRIMC